MVGWAMPMPLLSWWQRWLANRESFSQHPAQRNRRWRGRERAAAVVANDNAGTVWAVAVVVAAQGVVGTPLTGPRLRTARLLLAELSEATPPPARRVGP